MICGSVGPCQKDVDHKKPDIDALHHVRDGTMREDATATGAGSSAQVITAVRNTTVTVLRASRVHRHSSWLALGRAEPRQVHSSPRVSNYELDQAESDAAGGPVNDSPEEFEIRPSADQLPGLIFVPVPEAKQSEEPAALWTSGLMTSRWSRSPCSVRAITRPSRTPHRPWPSSR
jgi:hypothetical protein